MAQPFVPVPMRVWLRDRPVVTMLVMLIVNVAMLVFERFVLVFVGMPFRQVKPKADPHQNARDEQFDRQWLAKQGNCENCADEGREGVVRAGARAPEVT